WSSVATPSCPPGADPGSRNRCAALVLVSLSRLMHGCYPTRARAHTGWSDQSVRESALDTLAGQPEDDVLVDVLEVVAESLEVPGNLEERVGARHRVRRLDHVRQQFVLDLPVQLVDLVVHTVSATCGLEVLLGERL